MLSMQGSPLEEVRERVVNIMRCNMGRQNIDSNHPCSENQNTFP